MRSLALQPVYAQRAAVVTEALTWIGTPYLTGARVKGAGADCLTFIVEVFEGLGLVDHIEIPHYPPDWFLHQSTETYLTGLLDYCNEIAEGDPLPADVVLWRFGKCFSHGALVVNWPMIIHCQVSHRCGREDVSRAAGLTLTSARDPEGPGRPRPRKLFRFKEWC